jgi:hypothetical protein
VKVDPHQPAAAERGGRRRRASGSLCNQQRLGRPRVPTFTERIERNACADQGWVARIDEGRCRDRRGQDSGGRERRD